MRIALGAVLCLTVIVLALMGQVIWSRPQPTNSVSDQTIIEDANRHFEAVQHFLLTGDDHDLRDTLGVDFASWTSGSDTPAGFADYRAQLEAARLLFPNLELKQAILSVDDELVTVKLSPGAPTPAAFAGVLISASDLLGDTVILRFSHGHLVERWGFPVLHGIFTPYGAAPAGSPSGAALERGTIDFGHRDAPAFGVFPLALLVEHGAIRVEIRQESSHKGTVWTASGEQQPITAPATLDLSAGTALCLPAGAILGISPQNDQPATVLFIPLQMPAYGDVRHPTTNNLPSDEKLDPGGKILLDGPTTELELGAIHLDEGAELTVDPASGSTVLLFEAGALAAESLDRTVTTLAPGDARLSTPGTRTTYRATSASGADIFLISFASPAQD